jgi:penicillin-insensitive murein endopeptidase
MKPRSAGCVKHCGQMKLILFIILLTIIQSAFAKNAPSTCYGTTKDGRLKNGWQLPSSDSNFEAYSSVGVLAGRNYVHHKVYGVVTDAYKELEITAPNKKFIYGETGFKDGGQFRPHKTHRNGLSVDFFVPVINKHSESVLLPISPFNKLGYNIEFNDQATYKDLTIDFETIALHLLALHKHAKLHGVSINIVIFANEFQKKLFSVPSGKQLPNLMKFSVKKPWVRHDEHYHVDFGVKCA